MIKVERLKRRADFLAVAGQRRKYVAPGLILQACRRNAVERNSARLGFTASRKVGISVVRNRARRRLKAAAQQVLERHAAPGHDYVVIARGETLTRKFPDLLLDLETAMRRLGAWEE
jgi:ribonuclease P protein component